MKKWDMGGGVTATLGGMAGHVRNVSHIRQALELLQLLLHAYVLWGNVLYSDGTKYCDIADAHDYFVFVQMRMTPTGTADYPDLTRCLESEQQSRGLWAPFIEAGKSMSQAFRESRSDMSGIWPWTSPVVVSQYNELGPAECAAAEEGTAQVAASTERKKRRSRSRSQSAATPGPALLCLHDPCLSPSVDFSR